MTVLIKWFELTCLVMELRGKKHMEQQQEKECWLAEEEARTMIDAKG